MPDVTAEDSVTSMSSITNTLAGPMMEGCLSVFQEQLVKEQQELCSLMEEAVDEEEAPRYANCFYIKSGVLMRKWRPPAPALDEWQVAHQIVLPHCC